MRVISGTHRRRILLGPRGDQVTRPIPDRVKQSLFDRLWSLGAMDCSTAIDIFAGTGSIGIEALSRGVEHCVFVERDRSARTLLEQNLDNLSLTDRSTVLGLDAMMAGWSNLMVGRTAGLVFLDPPYKLTNHDASLLRLVALIELLAPVVEPAGLLVLRTDACCRPGTADNWTGPSSCSYGSTAVHFYQKSQEEQNPPHTATPPDDCRCD